MSFVFHFIYYMSIGNYFRIVFIIFLNKINIKTFWQELYIQLLKTNKLI